MKCLYCGGELERRSSTYTVDRKGYHLFIKEIPAYVCAQCGEKYFDEEEVEAIQKLIQKVEAGIEEVRMAG
jgi:YgiT-type zinc finger domain-containing protein